MAILWLLHFCMLSLTFNVNCLLAHEYQDFWYENIFLDLSGMKLFFMPPVHIFFCPCACSKPRHWPQPQTFTHG